MGRAGYQGARVVKADDENVVKASHFHGCGSAHFVELGDDLRGRKKRLQKLLW